MSAAAIGQRLADGWIMGMDLGLGDHRKIIAEARSAAGEVALVYWTGNVWALAPVSETPVPAPFKPVAHRLLRAGAVPSVTADFDGWIDWNGGKCPITSPDVEFQLRYRDDFDSEVRRLGAYGHRPRVWEHDPESPELDVIAYRIIGGGE